MLNYCEVTNTPFFFLYFTTGGSPLKLSTNDNDQRQNIKVDLVLATLSTRRKGEIRPRNGDRNSQQHPTQQQQQQQQQQKQQTQQLSNNVSISKGKDDTDFRTYQNSTNPQNAYCHVKEEEEEEDGDIIITNDKQNQQQQQEQDQHDLSDSNDKSTIQTNTNHIKNMRQSNKKRLKRLLESSSDEEEHS